MGVVSFNNGGGTILILAMIFSTTVAGEHHLQDKNRACISAKAEPTLNSSSCYPLVNFTRPFCQNYGIALPNYVYQTPDQQNNRNHEANKDYDVIVKLGGASSISRSVEVDINTVRKCLEAIAIGYCHLNFPSCDRTDSMFKEQKICRESCLELTHMCGELWKMLNAGISMETQTLQMHLQLQNGLQTQRIKNEMLKCSVKILLQVYQKLSNSRILEIGSFPDRWCEGLITPIFKSGDKTDPITTEEFA
ncbi:partial [Paramuricea clavata]|uniref:Partial n=1 Tax=Paramuricea clavata TaxID=317549 RepID=A0A7D9DJV8_PARCT|nr:partial [Paramuricea clavata]